MRVILYLQRRRGKRLTKPKGVPCYLDYEGDGGRAFALGGPNRPPAATLESAVVAAITADGIRLRGVEDPGGDGERLYLQEWWCAVGPSGPAPKPPPVGRPPRGGTGTVRQGVLGPWEGEGKPPKPTPPPNLDMTTGMRAPETGRGGDK